MKVAILETIIPSAHEVEFNRGLVLELRRQGHEPYFLVPPNFKFTDNYGVPVTYLEGGSPITYRKAGLIKKLFLSATREIRRIRWFSSAVDKAQELNCDCIVIPTASPRYLRSIQHSRLRFSKLPVVVNMQLYSFERKGRLEQFRVLAQKTLPYENIHITFCTHYHFIKDFKNVEYINPPFYGPSLIESKGTYDGHEPLVIGLYGIYRKDPNTLTLLKILAESEFSVPVKVIMQTVTNNERDQESCDEIVRLYKDNPRFTFFDGFLFAESWQHAIDDVDIILSPYASMQYFYAYSAMCFNALGFKKPVIISDSVNPQLLDEYKVGIKLDFKNYEETRDKVVNFINNFKTDYPQYLSEINRAAEVYSFENVVKGLLKYKAV